MTILGPSQVIDWASDICLDRCLRLQTVSVDDRQRFHAMAAQDKLRFDSDMLSYVPPPPDKAATKRSRKDPNAPKRPV